MAKDDKNFRGQDLRGRSFKGQNLTGADFSDCDLRGVNFSGANLTDAKFCNARMGEIYLDLFFKLSATSLLSGIILGLCNLYTLKIIKFNLDALHLYNEKLLVNLCEFYVYIIAFFLGVAIKQNSGLIFILLFIFIPFPFFPSQDLAIIEAALTIQILLVISIIGVIVISMMASIIIRSSALGIVVMAAISIIISVIVATEQANTEIGIPLELIIKAAKLTSSGYFGVSCLIAWYCMELEYSQLTSIRNFAIQLFRRSGTNFENANLTDTNFLNSDLKLANFRNSAFIRPLFTYAQNTHLAYTLNTPLEPRKVRDLVIDGITTDKDFSNLDLRGLDFSRLDLQGFDFSHANLSGANLSHCKLTGAILEGWHIDTETCLDDIDCRYYYYLEKGEKKRMPPEGEEYAVGEFSRIFQKVAETIDFIAHNEMELAAIKVSVEQVRVESGNNDIRVQAIEEKNGFIVVKVNVPKDEDRGVLYHEIKREYETKIQYLEKENYIQIGKIEVLKEQIKEQRDALLDKINAGDTVMGDKNISTKFKDSTINNSGILNLGEINGNLSQTIKQLPTENSELKALLNQLQTLINNSALLEQDKKEALTETQAIAEAATKPKEQQESIVRKTLQYFEDLASKLQDIPETIESITEIVEKIGVVFGS